MLSIAMLTALHLETVGRIGPGGLLIAAASGVGGGLVSAISPVKLQNASASIDHIGEEAEVIPKKSVVVLAITAVYAAMTIVLSHLSKWCTQCTNQCT